MIKAGLLYLIAGISLSVLSDIPGLDAGMSLLAIYWHMIVLGWITQVIMGVSIWMFPGRRRGKRDKESILPWFVFGFLNAGLILRFVSEPFTAGADAPTGLATVLVLSALLQTGGVLFYLIEMWPRVQAKRKRR